MKNNALLLLLFVAILVFSDRQVFGQLPWTRDANNPVLSGGTSGTWNYHLMWLSVLYNSDSARYEMWFTASSGQSSDWRPMRIGFATSADGINWEMYPDPVLEPDAGSWDGYSVEEPTVIREVGGQYKMWYFSWGGGNSPGMIGYATSSDGINWTKDTLNNPVMIPGSAGWQANGFTSPHVLPFEGGYKMWFAGWSANWQDSNIGYATSQDGITWIPDTLNNPVLTKGKSGRWDDGHVGDPVVLLIDSTYHMWYAGKRPAEGIPWQTGWATSADGIHWTKYNDPGTASSSLIDSDPVLRREDAINHWDEMRTVPGAVIYDEIADKLHMWYNGHTAASSWKIGHATAPVSIIYVPNQYATIQEAIDASSDGDIILVDEGTYFENINYKGKAITVASLYFLDGDTSHISATVIDGSNPANPYSGAVVTFESGEDTTSVLMGFTITGGTGTITQYIWDGTYPVRAGGGVFCYDAGARIARNKITINNIPHNGIESTGAGIAALLVNSSDYVIIESNQIVSNKLNGTYSWGSAVWLNNNGTIINNEVSYNTTNADNYAWGAVACGSDVSHTRNVVIKDNIISYNQANGQRPFAGGVSIEGGMSASIIGNLISHNTLSGTVAGTGGGIEIGGLEGTTIIDRNIISNNMVLVPNKNENGGGISLQDISANSNTSITNNIISNNSAAMGGGIRILNSKAEIANNTIVNNSAGTGGGIWTNNSQPVVINTIVWGNQANSDPGISGTPQIVYSDIQGGFTGEGNLNVDPLFVPGDSLFHLMATTNTSSCLNTGADSVQILDHMYYAPDHDYAGNSRPQPIGTRPDMGAWESDVVNSLEFLEGLQIPLIFELKQNYPNPFNPSTKIKFALPKPKNVKIEVYNIIGQKIETVLNKPMPAGHHEVEFNAGNLSSGIYLYRIVIDSYGEAGGWQDVKKMVLLK
jgi:predicted GH43/DUF377 family glycosyl hydrolase